MDLTEIKAERSIDGELLHIFDRDFYYMKEKHGRYYFNSEGKLVIEIQPNRIRIVINDICECKSQFNMTTLTDFFYTYTGYKKSMSHYYIVLPFSKLGGMICDFKNIKNPILSKYRK